MAGQPSIEARLGVMDLLARYAWAYDCRDVEAYGNVFTPDGVLEDGADLHAVGRDEVRKSIEEILVVRGADTWQHYHDQMLIRGSDTHCTVDCYWMVTSLKGGEHPAALLAMGYCHNVCVLIDGTWYLERRSFGYGLPAKVPAGWAA